MNEYLKKKSRREYIVKEWARQVDRDALVMLLEDEGVPLEEAVKKVQKFTDYADEIEIGLSALPGASHKRRQADERLENYCGDLFAPWTSRYIYWDDRGI